MRLALLLLACKGERLETTPVDTAIPAAAASGAPRFRGELDQWFLDRCVACHNEGYAESGLDLSGDLLDGRLLSPGAQTQDFPLIQPGDHRYSYLWHKVNGSQSLAGGSGTSMPVGASATTDEIERLAWWIDIGMP